MARAALSSIDREGLTNEPLRRLQQLRSEFETRAIVPPSTPTRANAVERSLNRHALIAVLVLTALVGGLGGWAALTNVAGAIVANGALVVDEGSQRVQHRDGGIVAQILAVDDDHVVAGQLLVRLADTSTAANLSIIEDQLRADYAQLARLMAESNGRIVLTGAPAEAGDLGHGAKFETLLTAQQQLLFARAHARDQQADQLRQQIEQLKAQGLAYDAQRTASQQSLDMATKEDGDLTPLQSKGLVDAARLNGVRRDRASFGGDVGRLAASIDQVTATIAEREVQIGQIDADFHIQVMTDMQSLREKIAELQQQRLAADDRLSHLEIRAPVSGIVHESSIHTVGGVVAPGDTLMLIVPQQSGVLVEARLSPYDVDKVTVGQGVILRFPGLDPRATPDLHASVEAISPDLIRDQASGQSYYDMRVVAPDAERAKLPVSARLVLGMPVEAFVQTGERSVLSYLLHPIAEQLSRMFIEK